MSEREQQSAAAEIVDPVVTSVAQHGPDSPGIVAGYLSHGGELDVVRAMDALRDLGWGVVLPVCGADASMEFCPWSPGDELAYNRYGIGEPTSAPIAIDAIDVVLVPGVGFDEEGSRIGHGVGFYDRFFARCAELKHEPLRLGIAHDLQIVDLPAPESWDVPMHRILTPTKMLDRS